MNNKTIKKSLKLNQTIDIPISKKDDSSPLKKINPTLLNFISSKKFNLNNNKYIPLNQKRATMKFTESKKVNNIKTRDNIKYIETKSTKKTNNNYSYLYPPYIKKKIPAIKPIEKKILIKYSTNDGAIENLFGESSSSIIEKISKPKPIKKQDGKLSRYIMKTPPPILNSKKKLKVIKRDFLCNSDIENSIRIEKNNFKSESKFKSKSTDISIDDGRKTGKFNTEPELFNVVNSLNTSLYKGGVVNLTLNQNKKKNFDSENKIYEEKIIKIQKWYKKLFKNKEKKLYYEKVNKIGNLIKCLNQKLKRKKKKFIKNFKNKTRDNILKKIKKNLNYHKPSLQKKLNKSSLSINLESNYFLPNNKLINNKHYSPKLISNTKKLDIFNQNININTITTFTNFKYSQENSFNYSGLQKKNNNKIIISKNVNDFQIKSEKYSSFNDNDFENNSDFLFDPSKNKNSKFNSLDNSKEINDFHIKSDKISLFNEIDVEIPNNTEITKPSLNKHNKNDVLKMSCEVNNFYIKNEKKGFKIFEMDKSKEREIIFQPSIDKSQKDNSFKICNKVNNFHIYSTNISSFKQLEVNFIKDQEISYFYSEDKISKNNSNLIISNEIDIFYAYKPSKKRKFSLNGFYTKISNFNFMYESNKKNVVFNLNYEINNFDLQIKRNKISSFQKIQMDTLKDKQIIYLPIKKNLEISNPIIDIQYYGDKKKQFLWIKLPLILMKILSHNLYSFNSKYFINQIKNHITKKRIKHNLSKVFKKEDLKILKYYFEMYKIKVKGGLKKRKSNNIFDKTKTKSKELKIKKVEKEKDSKTKELTDTKLNGKETKLNGKETKLKDKETKLKDKDTKLKKRVKSKKIKSSSSTRNEKFNNLTIHKEIDFEIEKNFYEIEVFSDSFNDFNKNPTSNNLNNSFEENRKNIKNMKLESIPKPKKVRKILARSESKSKMKILKKLERNERKRHRKLHFINNESLNKSMKYKQIRVVKKFFDEVTGNIIEVPAQPNILSERGYDSFIEENNLIDALIKEDKKQKMKRLIFYNLFRQYFRFWKYITNKKKYNKNKKPRFYDIIVIMMKCLFDNSGIIKKSFLSELYFIKGRYIFKWYRKIFGERKKKEKENLKEKKKILNK